MVGSPNPALDRLDTYSSGFVAVGCRGFRQLQVAAQETPGLGLPWFLMEGLRCPANGVNEWIDVTKKLL